MLPTILITDTAKIDPFPLLGKLPAGSIVIMRDYDLAPEKRLELAINLQKACKKLGLLFLVGKTPEIAAQIKADGIHLPEFMAKNAWRIRQKHPNWVITAAAHSRIAAYKAAKQGVDAVLISPVFKTKSHPNIKPLGIHRAKKMLSTTICAFALGGCTMQKVNLLKALKFQGIALVSGSK